MSKERMEEIKVVENWDNLNEWQFKEVAWLIEQAELTQHFAQKNGELNEFLQKYSEPKHLGRNVIDVAMDIITEQAERVEYYENQNDHKAQSHEEIYHLLNNDYFENWERARDIADDGSRDYVRHEKLSSDLKIRTTKERLKEQNKRYREALEFYANRQAYYNTNEHVSEVALDYGEKARKALECESNE